METGYLFAFATILLFGSWAVPTKTLSIPPKILALYLTIGHFLLSLFIFFYIPQDFSFEQAKMPFIAGIMWAIGIIAGFRAIKELGITRALGIWIPIVIIISSLWGLFYFGEALSLGTEKVLVSFGAILILIAAAFCIILSAEEEKKKVGNTKLGFLGAITLGLFHGSFFVPLRLSEAGITAVFVPLTLGMVLTTVTFAAISREKIFYNFSSIYRMILGGFLLGGGNYTAILTTLYLGVSKGYPLTQLGIIVNALWGVFFFREVATKKGKILIALGVVMALIGSIILNQAKI